MPVKAVIFDLDGTITRPFLDFDLIRREMGLALDAGPVLEIMIKMSPDERKLAEEILHRHEKNAVEKSTLSPGAEQTLSVLADKDIHIGILTRNTRANALAIAGKHNLSFDAVVGREDGPVKPDGFGILRLCRQFGTDPADTLMVGDYLYDLLSARAAGAIAVLLETNQHGQDFSEHADFTINSLDQILQIIDDKARQLKEPADE